MTVTASLVVAALLSGVTALLAWLERGAEIRRREWLQSSLERVEGLVLGQDVAR